VTSVDRFAPALSEDAVLDRARSFAREASPDHPVLLVRSQPHWAGPEVVSVGDKHVRVLGTSSPLRVLDELRTAGDNEYLLVLTDRDRHELGDAIVLRTRRREVETLDEWNRVPALFGAQAVDGRLRKETGKWLPRALLQWQPAEGWPRVPAGMLPAPLAIGALLARILGHDPAEALDTAMVLDRLDSPGTKERWRELDDEVRSGLGHAVGAVLSPAIALALRIAESCGPVSVVAIGLALDALWPAASTAAPTTDQIAARTRIERLTGVRPDPAAVRGLADAAIALTLRWEDISDTAVPHTLNQAQAVLGEYGWPQGSDHSTVLQAGMLARVRAVAAAALRAVDEPSAGSTGAMETALGRLSEHLFGARYRAEVLTAQMAVRAARWLLTPAPEVPTSLADAVAQYRADGAWADRAVSVLWDGSSDTETSNALNTLVTRVRDRRGAEERALASVITGDAIDRHDVTGIENVWERVVRPLAAEQPVLWLVLDGMSADVASELDGDIVREGWSELAVAGAAGALTAVATIPSVTQLSRASLFSGELARGGQDVEKAAVARRGGILFHKDDLRSDAGQALPAAVTSAIADAGTRIVGVVLNTIDDALAKADPGGTRWGLVAVQHLRSLLAAAATAGRIVVFTSDHGHVIERGGEARPTAGAAQRWRSVESGPVGDGEVRVSGPRVLVDGNAVIAAQRDDLRYAAKAAGYHGGVSLAELTVPITVYRQAHTPLPSGWVDAAPAAPRWWNEPLNAHDARMPEPERLATPRRPARPVEPAPGAVPLDFEIDDTPPAQAPSASSLSARVLASDVYATQKARAGRAALADSVVESLLSTLEQGGGRAHRDTLAAAAGVPTGRFDSTIVTLRRVLNVDAYEVVATDPDGVTVHLDIPLLVQQFGLDGVTR